jgi:ribosome-binding factor A
MGESLRVNKFNRLIQKDLSVIFQQEGPRLFNNPLISVTEVKTSPDLSMAKCYLSFFKAGDKKQLINEINLRKSEIRGILGHKIGKHIRKIPDLVFFVDDTSEQADKIENLLSGLDIPDQKKNYGLDAYEDLEE